MLNAKLYVWTLDFMAYKGGGCPRGDMAPMIHVTSVLLGCSMGYTFMYNRVRAIFSRPKERYATLNL